MLQLTRDRAIVLSCMGIALVFWLLAKLSQGYTMEKPVVIDLTIPPQLAIVKTPPANLVAEVKGTGWALLFNYLRSPKVVLRQTIRQQKTVYLSYRTLLDQIDRTLMTQDLKVTRLNFEELTIRLEPRISRSIPIELGQRSPYAPGYWDRQPPLILPPVVEVSGPLSRVMALKKWELARLQGPPLKTDFKKKVLLRKAPPELTLEPQEVMLHLRVEQYTEKSLFLPVRILNKPKNLGIFPSRIKLTCRVGLSRYSDLNASAFEAVVDASTYQPGSEKNTLGITITREPSWVKNCRYSTLVAEVFVRRP